MTKTKRRSVSYSRLKRANKRDYLGLWNHIDEYVLDRERLVFLPGPIDSDAVLILTRLLTYLAGRSRAPIHLRLNTPGGTVTDGLALYDLLRSCPAPIHAIATGGCMSMGVIVLQAAKVRQATANTTFMLHEVATLNFGGSLSEGSNVQRESERLQRVLDTILQKRSGLTKKEASKWMRAQPRYFTAEQALKGRLIDTII